jgi:hypothetical protein
MAPLIFNLDIRRRSDALTALNPAPSKTESPVRTECEDERAQEKIWRFSRKQHLFTLPGFETLAIRSHRTPFRDSAVAEHLKFSSPALITISLDRPMFLKLISVEEPLK